MPGNSENIMRRQQQIITVMTALSALAALEIKCVVKLQPVFLTIRHNSIIFTPFTLKF
jgi:hypothetical protein